MYEPTTEVAHMSKERLPASGAASDIVVEMTVHKNRNIPDQMLLICAGALH